MRLSVAIQHHPSRAALLPGLLASVGQAEVVDDPEPDGTPSPLRTYLEALRRTPPDATHRLVLQDDVEVVQDFPARTEDAIAEHPDVILCLFVPGTRGGGGAEVREAHARGLPSVRIRTGGWVPAVATAWPAALARDFLAYMGAAAATALREQRSDDAMIGKFARDRRLEVWATIPSLVEHPDREASLIGRKAGAGGNRGRVAAIFTG